MPYCPPFALDSYCLKYSISYHRRQTKKSPPVMAHRRRLCEKKDNKKVEKKVERMKNLKPEKPSNK